MTRRRLLAFLVACYLSLVAVPAYAALTLSTDHRSLFFGLMQLGEEKILANAGSHHNQVTVSSTSGRTWYLKISVLQPLSSGADTIPLEHFRWELVDTSGRGTIASHHEPRPFTLSPEMVYFSSPDEASGQSVQFRFRYLLTVPEAQVSGTYQTTIRFTLSEVL